MNMIVIVILVAISFGLLVLGHEFGHFILAKINGVKVEEFAIGMGPQVFKIKGKETIYTLRLLPIGGFVKMLGEYEGSEEEIAEEDKDRTYTHKHPLRKISIVLAGPIMNFIMAFLIFIGLNMFKGFATTQIKEVVDGSPAQEAGLEVGDKLITINGSKFYNWNDFVFKLQTSPNKQNINLTVLRNNEKVNLNIEPKIENNSMIIGIKPEFIEKPNFFQSISMGFKETVVQIKQIMWSLGQLITGKAAFKDLSGPITIFKVSGKAAQAGIANLLNFTAFLSINLGVFNLIPFPALDGGAVIVNLVELVRKKRIKQEILGKINIVGFALLILLMIAITIKDIFFPINL